MLVFAEEYGRKSQSCIFSIYAITGEENVMTDYFTHLTDRSGGAPDLILWNFSEKECMFSEVKGPGDTLSASQRVWIDLMLKVGVKVEVCKVMTSEMVIVEEEKSARRKKAAAERSKKKRKAGESDDEEEEEDDE